MAESNEIKLNLDGMEAHEYLRNIQKHCRERTYGILELRGIAADFRKRLRDMGVLVKDMPGCKVDFGGGWKMPNAYKYPVIGTVGTIELGKDGRDWLIMCRRTYCSNCTRAWLTDAAKRDIMQNVESTFSY